MNLSSRALVYVMRALVFLIAIPFHESAHAFVAWKLGDPTAKAAGRMTMNPLAHFDPMGAVLMILCGVGFAKPVPINAGRFKNPKCGMALSALAGPVSNLLLAYVSMIAWKLLYYCAPVTTGFTYLAMFCRYMVLSNVALAVFNMLPVPPWDGSRVLLVFLPQRIYFKVMQYERQIFIVMFLLLAVGVLDGPLYTLENAAFSLLLKGTGYIETILYALHGAGAAVGV